MAVGAFGDPLARGVLVFNEGGFVGRPLLTRGAHGADVRIRTEVAAWRTARAAIYGQAREFMFVQLDPRPGGGYHSCIHNPSFGDCWCTGVYQEVVAPERLVFTSLMANEKGEAVSSVQAGHDAQWPDETTTTVTFEEEPGGKTKVTLHQTVSETLAKQTGAYPSWLQMLDRLDAEVGA